MAVWLHFLFVALRRRKESGTLAALSGHTSRRSSKPLDARQEIENSSSSEASKRGTIRCCQAPQSRALGQF